MGSSPEAPESPLEGVRLDSSQVVQAAGVLARAFQNDPLMVYYLQDPARRARVLPGFMRAALRYCMRYGEVFATPGLEGISCWLPPGETHLRTLAMARAGMGVVSIRLGWWAYQRMARLEPLLDRIHSAAFPSPHWYLMILGVDPGCQGAGNGSRLLAWKLARIRVSGLPCYLETMSARNLPFYRKNGFRVVSETEVDAGKLSIWGMAA